VKILYLGSGDIGLPTLRALAARHEVAAVVTQPDQPAGRGLALRTSPIKSLAVELGLAVLQPARVRQPEAVAELAAFRADAIVVFAYGQILPQAVLDLPRLACLNIHASLLPRWRGAAPIQAAILAGDAVSGHTIMFMDAGLDTGDILLQRPLTLAADETGGSLHDRLAALAPECILEALDLLAAGRAPRAPQENALATPAPKLNRESGRLDWSRPAVELERRVRAFQPWPGTFTTLPAARDGEPGRVLKVFSVGVEAGEGLPGSVLGADAAGLLVATADGALRLRELQQEGRKRLPAGEFLRGQPIDRGTVLDS
jgi:methionyl-tRNA formyltransferase